MNTIFSYQRVNFDSLMQLNIQLNKKTPSPDREEASIIYISESIKKITSSHFLLLVSSRADMFSWCCIEEIRFLISCLTICMQLSVSS